jgi:hypothetical protein
MWISGFRLCELRVKLAIPVLLDAVACGGGWELRGRLSCRSVCIYVRLVLRCAASILQCSCALRIDRRYCSRSRRLYDVNDDLVPRRYNIHLAGVIASAGEWCSLDRAS